MKHESQIEFLSFIICTYRKLQTNTGSKFKQKPCFIVGRHGHVHLVYRANDLLDSHHVGQLELSSNLIASKHDGNHLMASKYAVFKFSLGSGDHKNCAVRIGSS